MGVLFFIVVSIALVWALLLLAVSSFFRGVAFAAIGAIILNIARGNHYPPVLIIVGVSFLLLPVFTLFKRAIFGE